MSRRLIIVIIIITIVIVSGGIWYWLKSANPPKRMVFKTQEECKKATGRKCSFGMCDYKCPNNDYWKGWAPTGEKINKVVCDYDNPNKRYFYKTINECSVVKYKCEEGRSFSDDCGCGCETKNIKSDINIESYLACGCGCCGGEETADTKCLYRSKGDDLNKIIEEDKKFSQNSNCQLMGCSIGVLYKYCD